MRYSEQSRNLAASVVLEAAVAEAVAVLRRAPTPERPGGWIAAMCLGHTATAELILLAAGESAELLLGSAS